jgi:hypothetical protein
VSGADAVHTRPLVGLDLDQFGHIELPAGGGHHPQVPVGVDEHDAGGVGREQRHAVPDEPVEHVDDVVVVD